LRSKKHCFKTKDSFFILMDTTYPNDETFHHSDEMFLAKKETFLSGIGTLYQEGQLINVAEPFSAFKDSGNSRQNGF
jgi:hypothetical protein